MTSAPQLSTECTGWARIAHYDTHHDNDTTILKPTSRDRGSYRIRWRNPGHRIQIIETDAEGNEEELLYAANIDIAERFIIAIVGDEVRDELDLDYLELPTRTIDLHPDYRLGDLHRGYRTLTHHSQGPVAASRDATLSLVRLVPLPHFLAITTADLKRSYLHETGRPLLAGGKYRPPAK